MRKHINNFVFVSPDIAFTNLVALYVSAVPSFLVFTTTGGTSDARFICKICPVAEFGLVGRTMHKIDEHVAIDDIETLVSIYHDILARAVSLQEGS